MVYRFTSYSWIEFNLYLLKPYNIIASGTPLIRVKEDIFMPYLC